MQYPGDELAALLGGRCIQQPDFSPGSGKKAIRHVISDYVHFAKVKQVCAELQIVSHSA